MLDGGPDAQAGLLVGPPLAAGASVILITASVFDPAHEEFLRTRRGRGLVCPLSVVRFTEALARALEDSQIPTLGRSQREHPTGAPARQTPDGAAASALARDGH